MAKKDNPIKKNKNSDEIKPKVEKEIKPPPGDTRKKTKKNISLDNIDSTTPTPTPTSTSTTTSTPTPIITPTENKIVISEKETSKKVKITKEKAGKKTKEQIKEEVKEEVKEEIKEKVKEEVKEEIKEEVKEEI